MEHIPTSNQLIANTHLEPNDNFFLIGGLSMDAPCSKPKFPLCHCKVIFCTKCSKYRLTFGTEVGFAFVLGLLSRSFHLTTHFSA